ncbi:MAG: 2,3-bisphosphoglycerate-independent phosphoglycerate mutase [Bacteroidota bacterium]
MRLKKKVLLTILDGWGLGDGSKADVISQANTPNMDKYMKEYPNSRLKATGEAVGLPEGQQGNSEVGHYNIGAGRIVYQDLVRINKAIENDTLKNDKTLRDALNFAKEHNKRLHFLGLVSDGGVHSMNDHLYYLCDVAKEMGLEDVYIHALTDGRDVDPHSGIGFIKELQQHLENSAGKIATICGRYYTMDRDKRWERIKKGYDLMVHGDGLKETDPVEAMQNAYDRDESDEFIKPIVITDDSGEPLTTIEDGDVVVCFNFRTDRLRQITVALTQKEFPEYDMHTLDLYYVTLTEYDDTYQDVDVVFGKIKIEMGIGEYLSKLGKTQLRIAETEKYAHVTFFFSGGREEEFPGEDRCLVNSPKVATYDLQPEMSAPEVKDKLIAYIDSGKYDFICHNFANCDMVGHSGIYDAIVKAAETVDSCVGEIVEAALRNDYTMIIIADHGNADHAVNEDGSPNTNHSMNMVPCILINSEWPEIEDGILADVAPTILKIMDTEIPQQMTGKYLVKR